MSIERREDCRNVKVPVYNVLQGKHSFLEKYKYKGRNRQPDSYDSVYIGLRPVSERFHHYPSRIKTYQYSAQTRQLEWSLSNKEASLMLGSDCHYCGRRGPGGIDRIDSNEGYIEPNTVPCCSRCNFSKGTLSAKEFVEMCHQVSERMTIEEAENLDLQSLVGSANYHTESFNKTL